MQRITTQISVSKLRKSVKKCQSNEKLRVKGFPKAFTRKRRLSVIIIIIMIIRTINKSLQIMLDEITVENGVTNVSKQAFSQARQQINPEFIRELYDENAEYLAGEESVKTWKGKRVIAIDGTTLAIENTPELKEYFGCSGRGEKSATARASLATDVFEGIAYDCRISPYKKSEVELADEHIKRLSEIGLCKSIILADRGYPSYEFMGNLLDNGFDFLIRISRSWTTVISEIENCDSQFDYELNGVRYDCRAVTIQLDNGECEYLVTSLSREVLSLDETKYLYSLRWNIETKYDFIKNKLELENFSGKTRIAVMQDFYAAVLISNIAACAISAADEEIEQADSSKNLKHSRKTKRNYALSHIVRVFLTAMIETDDKKRDKLFDQVYDFCERAPLSVRPNRNPDRKVPRSKHFHIVKR